jgi:hypothetical protein
MSYLSEQNKCGLKINDMVIVTRKAFKYENGWENLWPSYMDEIVGKVCKITGIYNTGILLEDGKYNRFYFPYFVLKKYDEELIKKQNLEELE